MMFVVPLVSSCGCCVDVDDVICTSSVAMYNPTANASHRVVGDGIWSSGSFSGVSPINACKHCNILEEEEDEKEDEGEDVLVESIPSSISTSSTAHSAATSFWWGWTPLLVVLL